ncbi:hypothetical protein [Flavobacterium sp. GCM10027622]|uniref:hypothetical protein n=1 Tax=unclassified Flavobacterium TaxID=196869 RepID=UPI0036221C2B
MLKTKISIILFLTSYYVKAQNIDKDFMWLSDNNDGVKQITISKNDKIGIIQNFNRNGKPYFIKNSEFNGDKVFAVWYFQWDNENNMKSLTFAHSNIGVEIEIYSKDKKTNKTYTYLTKETEKFVNNVDDLEINEFSYLDEIKQINDTISLLKSKSYTDLLKRKKYLLIETVLDDNQKEISSKTYNYKKKVESSSSTKYQDDKIIVDYSNNFFGIKDLTIKEIDSDGNIISETTGDNLTKYSYQNKKLTEKLIFEQEKVISRTIYIYKDNLLIQEIYEDVQSGRKYVDKYEYNERGKLSLKTITREDGESQYKYEYVYW